MTDRERNTETKKEIIKKKDKLRKKDRKKAATYTQETKKN